MHLHSHTHADEHSHDHAASTPRLLALATVLTVSFMAVELAGGLIARSLALIADAGHMLTDAAALTLAWAAVKIATRPADTKRTYGYQRFRVLATFINGCALFGIVAWIIVEAIQRLLTPSAINAALLLWIGGAGAVVNLIVFALLKRGTEHDMNVAAASLHVLGDLLSSLAAIVAGAAILWTGWTPIDPLLSLLVCVLIVRSAWHLVRRSAHILLEGSPDWLDLAELRAALEQRVPAIRDVHHVHCWSVGPQETLLTMHVTVSTQLVDHSRILREAKTLLAQRYGITHATLQIEAEECVDAECEHTPSPRG